MRSVGDRLESKQEVDLETRDTTVRTQEGGCTDYGVLSNFLGGGRATFLAPACRKPEAVPNINDSTYKRSAVSRVQTCTPYKRHDYTRDKRCPISSAVKTRSNAFLFLYSVKEVGDAKSQGLVTFPISTRIFSLHL